MGLLHVCFILAFTFTLAAPTSDQQSLIQRFSAIRLKNVQELVQRANFAAASKLLQENSSPSTDDFALGASGRQSGGFTGDQCRSGEECRGARKCLQLVDGAERVCEPDQSCICFQAKRCSIGDSCGESERCVELDGVGEHCVSNSYADMNEGVCIAAHSLRHVPKEHLVFEKDVLANVLCDSNDSCATAGHMVLFKGTPMMMKSYCVLVGCVNKVMKVNSPRYSRAVTIPSQSEHLEFTLFAAQYETQAEEGFLSVAVKLGF